jgi:putative ABC transport system permease protein
MWRSVSYWMLETGMGMTVILTAVLGILVTVVVTSQTLFTITQDHLGNYATLLALGFSRGKMLGGVILQGLILSGVGISLGSAAFLSLSRLSARTPIPLETTPAVFTGLVVLSVACCLLGSFLSIKTILRIDPIAAFRV